MIKQVPFFAMRFNEMSYSSNVLLQRSEEFTKTICTWFLTGSGDVKQCSHIFELLLDQLDLARLQSGLVSLLQRYACDRYLPAPARPAVLDSP